MTSSDPSWETHIAAFTTALRAAGRTEQTINLRAYHLARLARWSAPRGPWDLALEDLQAWLGGQRWSRATLRSYRASLRGFYGWAVLTGRVATSPALGLPPVGVTAPNPRPTPESTYRLALAKADPRERLMLRLGADLGMRRGEVAQVHTGDVVEDLLGWSLLVHGKGRKVRLVPLPDDLARRLLARPVGYVFPGDDHGHLSARWVGRLVSRLLPDGIAMHSLRHRAATRWHELDPDLLTIQELLGHASPVTTQAYVRVSDDRKRRLVLAGAGAAGLPCRT